MCCFTTDPIRRLSRAPLFLPTPAQQLALELRTLEAGAAARACGSGRMRPATPEARGRNMAVACMLLLHRCSAGPISPVRKQRCSFLPFLFETGATLVGPSEIQGEGSSGQCLFFLLFSSSLVSFSKSFLDFIKYIYTLANV